MVKSIKILGSGCPKCKQSADIVNEVVKENDLNIEVEKVEDIVEMLKYNIMSTPAIIIDDEVVIKGRVPSKSELIDLLL